MKKILKVLSKLSLKNSKPQLTGSTFIIQVPGFLIENTDLYSISLGHGTRNVTVQIDQHNFTRKLTDVGFETVNPAKVDSMTGDCMIGSSGKLYSVEELKCDLLKLSCPSVTVTLDMCRNEMRSRSGSKENTVRPVASIRKVELR